MVKEAAIIAVALVIAGFLAGGRYTVASGQFGPFRLDRFTGDVCTQGASCWSNQ